MPPYNERSAVRDMIAELQPLHQSNALLDLELTFATFDDARPIGIEAISGSGFGIDLFRGERIVAAILRRETPHGYEHRWVAAITDVRTVVSGWSNVDAATNLNGLRMSIPHSDIYKIVTDDGFLTNRITLTTSIGEYKLNVPYLVPQLDWFYRTLTSYYTPEQRVAPPAPLVEASPDDPAGARTAKAKLWEANAKAGEILDTIASRVARGDLEVTTATDLTGRVVLAARTLSDGPAADGPAWVHALPAGRLADVLLRAFGTPLSDTADQTTRYLIFAFQSPGNAFPTAAAALGLIEYETVGVGVGPARLAGRSIANALMAKTQVDTLRFSIVDRDGFSEYLVYSQTSPLVDHDSYLMYQLNLLLARSAIPELDAMSRASTSAPGAHH